MPAHILEGSPAARSVRPLLGLRCGGGHVCMSVCGGGISKTGSPSFHSLSPHPVQGPGGLKPIQCAVIRAPKTHQGSGKVQPAASCHAMTTESGSAELSKLPI